MDNFTTILNFNELCRTCMVSTKEENLTNISEVTFGNDVLVELLQKFDINLTLNDEFPPNICNSCVNQINQFHTFLQNCKSTNEQLQSILNSKKEEILIIKLEEEEREVNLEEEEEEEGEVNLDETDELCVLKEEENVTIRPVCAMEQGPPYSCNVCDKSFDHFGEIKRHRKKEKHWRRHKYVCPVCDDGKLYSYQCCVVHIRTHRDEKPFRCEYCNRGFKTNFNKKQHLRTHTGERPHMCESCGKGFAVLPSLKRHICSNSEMERVHMCKFCSNKYNDYTLYLRHLRRHKTDSNIKYHECDQCGKKFTKKSVLTTHKAVHSEKKFLCNTCGEEFHYMGSLKNHLNTHETKRPYSCEFCGKSFSIQSTLIQHKRVHTGERPFECDLCGKTFKQTSHLRNHKRLHEGVKKFECSFCGKRFLMKGTLTVHERKHTGYAPYVCDICERGFYDSTSMKTHRKRHQV